MTEIVVNYNSASGEYQIYESSTQTLLISSSIGEGFANLNLFLLKEGLISTSIIEDPNILYHFDSHTFQEMIKSNMALLKRVSDIPSEFKNSASKFGMPSVPRDIVSKNKKQGFSKNNFQRGKFQGQGGSNFGKSFKKFSGGK